MSILTQNLPALYSDFLNSDFIAQFFLFIPPPFLSLKTQRSYKKLVIPRRNEYTKGVGTLERAIPIKRYLFLEEKRGIDKCRLSWCDAALFLLSSIIFKTQSRMTAASWAIARSSLKDKEAKSSMKKFIESPPFLSSKDKLVKKDESKEDPSRMGKRSIKSLQ